MEQGIKYVITGDTSGLVSAEKQAENALDKLNKKIGSLQSEIAQNIKISQGYENAIASLTAEFKRGAISQDQYTKSLERLQRDEKETTIETKRLRSELTRLNRDQKSLQQANTSTGKSFENLERKGGGATATVTAFGGVIQDAPYGVRGVANNIEFLTTSFVNLQKSAGGTVPAIKAFFSSLAGPAGIIIAVSAITSGLTALSQSGVRLSDVLSFLTGESNDLAKAQRDLAEASRDAVGEAASEVATIKSLVGVLQDNNKSNTERLRAYQKINDLQPSVLDGLTLEDAKTQDLTKNIDLLTASLIREAKIRGAQELISKETAKILEAESKNVIDSANAWDFLVAGMSGVTAVSEATIRGARRQGEEIDGSRKKIEQFTQRLQELIGEDIALEGFFTDVGKNAREGIEKAIKLEPLDLSGLKFSEMDKLAEQAAYIFSTQFGKEVKVSDLTGDISITGDLSGLTRVISAEKLKLADELAKIEETLLEFNTSASQIISENITGTFSELAKAIGSPLEEGESMLDRLGSVLLGGISSVLMQLGELAIATGVSLLAIEVALKSLNPFVAIAAGVALIALASSVESRAADIGEFAQGGMIGGGSFTGDKVPILANSGEYVLTAQDQGYLTNFLRGNTGGTANTGGAIRVTGRIEAEGGKLVTVISESQTRNKRLGGSRKL